MITIDRLCTQITEIIHIPIQVYDMAQNRIKTYYHSKEQIDVLAFDPQFLSYLFSKRRSDSPIIYVEEKCIIYGILTYSDQVYLVGPCSLDVNTTLAVKIHLKAHKLSLKESYRMVYTEMFYFCRILILLYEALTEDYTMDLNHLFVNSFVDGEFVKKNREAHYQVLYKTREAVTIHNSYNQEEREQAAIRAGDLVALHHAFHEQISGEVGKLAFTPIRQMKNLAIVIITLASRSAIAGGLLPEVSFTMSDAYIQQVESASSENDAFSIARQAEMEYCQLVHDIIDGNNHNQLVLQCKTMIFQSLHYKITNYELAEKLHVNPDYLSRLFKKEEGIHLKDYIIREKIKYSKSQLIYTNDSYKDIANTYAFASQSYYGKMFKKWTGMTPREYRMKNQNINGSAK